MSETCSSCSSYVGVVNKGKCCKRAPTGDHNGVAIFPIVYGLIDWCAEYTPITNKKVTSKKKTTPPPPPPPPKG